MKVKHSCDDVIPPEFLKTLANFWFTAASEQLVYLRLKKGRQYIIFILTITKAFSTLDC